MIKRLNRKYKMAVAVFILVALLLTLFLNPKVKSQYWFYKKQMIYNSLINEQSKIVSKMAEPWPEWKNPETISKEELPADYKILLQAFLKPKISKVTFENNSKGWVIQEESDRQIRCPLFPMTLNRKLHLNFRKTLSHVVRYQYSDLQNTVLVETRLRAFSCEVEVILNVT